MKSSAKVKKKSGKIIRFFRRFLTKLQKNYLNSLSAMPLLLRIINYFKKDASLKHGIISDISQKTFLI
ncbi:MAG: hypothetical protein B6D64_10705 [Bacteroidetes bacterium 4484_276]|nr:MAG: hypothetical protein B6D64_10705 [Bacteroidetes bacterium 4484_276]